MRFLLIVLSIIIISSCSTRKQIVYFQDLENLNNTELQGNFEPVIKPTDILFISLSALNEEVLAPFKKQTSTNNTNNNNPSPLLGYLVDQEGTIRFPVLGAVPVAGKSRSEVEALLTEKLSEYVTNVVVDVRLQNFSITVLGEVNNPGQLVLTDDRVTLPEVIAAAGDFSEDGRRDNVTIIREEDGKKQVAKIDFTKTEFFDSPYYYMKQNDIVYVEPTLRGVKKSGFITNIPGLLSLFSVVLSTIVLITR